MTLTKPKEYHVVTCAQSVRRRVTILDIAQALIDEMANSHLVHQHA